MDCPEGSGHLTLRLADSEVPGAARNGGYPPEMRGILMSWRDTACLGLHLIADWPFGSAWVSARARCLRVWLRVVSRGQRGK